LTRYALISQRANGKQTYAGVSGKEIIGFYALAVGHVAYDHAPDRLKKKLSRHPVPVIILAWLGVDLDWQGKGVAAGLLRDAMQRTVQVTDIAGLRVFPVHAKNRRAKAFYEHFDFMSSPTDPYHLFLLLKDIRKIMSE